MRVTLIILPFTPLPSGSVAAAPGSPVSTGSGPRSVVISDFNGDGISDVATANYNNNNVTVLLGTGLGGFTAAPGSPFTTGAGPYALTSGDFNGDGIVDLAIANNSENSVTVLLGNGSGGFTAAPGSPFATGAFPIGIVAGDFNRDSSLDLAIANSGDSTITVLLGNNAGGFTKQTTGVQSISSTPVAIAAGDFNNDGTSDVVVTGTTGGVSTATVLLGGNLGFSVAGGSPFTLPSQSFAVVACDWSDDGTLDLAFAGTAGTAGANGISAYVGSGNGGFTSSPTLSLGAPGAKFNSIACGDLDGDGNQDLVLTSLVPSNAVYFALGNSAGAFAAAPGGPVATPQPYSVQIGDLNGHNRSSLAIANFTSPGTVTLLLDNKNPAIGMTSVNTSGNPVLLGTNVTFTFGLTFPGLYFATPTGSVGFYDGGFLLGSAPLVNGNTATFSTSSLGVGSHATYGDYLGDPRTSGSAANTSPVVVDASASTISVFTGNPQTLSVNSQAAPLSVIVRDSNNLPIGGVTVTFTAPNSGPSGSFSTAASVVTVNGIATAPTFTANALGGSYNVTASISSPGISTAFSITNVVPVALRFIAVTPCRIADTRGPAGAFGAPSLAGGNSRAFLIPNSACGIPATAHAYSLNATAVPQGPLGYLTLYPTGSAQPFVSTLNSSDGRVKANAAIISAGSGGGVSVFASNVTDFVLDIDGYFVSAVTPGALAFYPLAPCRVADTRLGTGALGGPYMPALSTRSFPVLSSSCSVPATAQAYSLNFAAIPRTASLSYITVYPTGQGQPTVSTLNAGRGTVTANAAIVPIGAGGAISVFTTDDTDLAIDINGYFAPAGLPGNLSLYNLQPCRILDTRLPQPQPPISGVITAQVASTVCGAPSSAQAFVLNATVVPSQPFGYLTLWAQGGAQPVVSTLNASDAAITSNMAIVPTTNGSISAFASNPTALIMDLVGYFAP